MKKFWIGDLCYVIEDWTDFCDKTINGSEIIDGEITLNSGAKVWFHGTAHGDGVYFDQYENEYGVDAGLIGIIEVSDITNKSGINLGHIFEFEEFPECDYENGLITFGSVRIDTDPDEDYDEEYCECL